jgi:hypothetical protein
VIAFDMANRFGVAIGQRSVGVGQHPGGPPTPIASHQRQTWANPIATQSVLLSVQIGTIGAS